MSKHQQPNIRKQIKEDRLICVQIRKHKYIDITNCKPFNK